MSFLLSNIILLQRKYDINPSLNHSLFLQSELHISCHLTTLILVLHVHRSNIVCVDTYYSLIHTGASPTFKFIFTSFTKLGFLEVLKYWLCL